MAETMNAVAAHKAVSENAKTKQNAKTRRIDDEAKWPYGKCFRQGDILLKRHPLKDYDFRDMKKREDHQLVDGTTVGSRHVILNAPGLKIWDRENADALTGPVVEAPNGFYLEHPTHGDVDCTLPGSYEVTFPRDFAAEEAKRLAD